MQKRTNWKVKYFLAMEELRRLQEKIDKNAGLFEKITRSFLRKKNIKVKNQDLFEKKA